MNVPDHIQESVAYEFKRLYPEFYDCPHNAKLLSESVEKYTAAGRPFSVDTVAGAYHALAAAGALQEPEPDAVELSHDEQARQKYVAELANNVDAMTDSHLDRALQQLGVWVPMTNGRMWRDS